MLLSPRLRDQLQLLPSAQVQCDLTGDTGYSASGPATAASQVFHMAETLLCDLITISPSIA